MGFPKVDSNAAAEALRRMQEAARRAADEARRKAAEAAQRAKDAAARARTQPRAASALKSEFSTGQGRALRDFASKGLLPGSTPGTASSAQASSLRTEVLGDGKANCLEKALATAKRGDQVVLFKDQQDPVGHAVVQRGDGAVVDPNTPDQPYASVADFQQKNPRYSDPVTVDADRAKQALALPPGAARDAALKTLGLSGVADRQVADDGVRTALDDYKAARASAQEASGSGNFSRVEHSDEEVSAKRAKLKAAIDASGVPLDQVNEKFGAQSGDPAERMMIADVTAELARDKADAVAKKYGLTPNLEGRNPDAEHIGEEDRKKVSPESDKASREARELEGKLQDQLLQVTDQSVATLRGQGLSREDAIATLKKSAGPDAANVLEEKPGVPNTLGMTNDEKTQVYEKIFLEKASPDAKAAYERGEKVLLGVRHDTPVYANDGRGEFDDKFVVLQKPHDGQPQLVKEYRACLDPNTQYGNGIRDNYDVKGKPENMGQYSTYHEGGTFSDPSVDAYSRISGGQTIRMQTGPDGRLYPPPGGGYQVDADLNGDGVFNDGFSKTNPKNGYELHGSAVGHTGSGGCVTVPFYQWDEFQKTITGGQPTVSEKQGHWPWSPSKDESTIYMTIV
ncbi:MAG: hypothetical protein K1X89_17020 [Myxococcaceae bacterium]|nr:hypothetical protein [Myxococcaceae bacterium]